MIFIANVLVMNGGTTFLIRLTRELHRRGRRCAVLLLSDRCDPALVDELARYADIFPLREHLADRGVIARGLLGVFAPLATKRLAATLSGYGNHVHVMGAFGLIMALRLAAAQAAFRITIGIYHQNEFIYRAPPFYFPRQILRLFGSIPATNVIFFNETSRANYVDYYNNQEYLTTALVPVGITIDLPPALPPEPLGCRILSIGNLVAFKTYNAHVIRVVAALKARFPGISYDIYGAGPEADRLVRLAIELDVADRIRLHGTIQYADVREAVEACDLFVGSGTSLVEAAAVGRPAMIGIESISTPETYGYLSDAHGFSYHENVPHFAKQSMETLVAKLFANPGHWTEIARACATKAKSFSVTATADGFETAACRALPITYHFPALALARLAASAVAMSISERFGRSEPFGDRRNQSYSAKQ